MKPHQLELIDDKYHCAICLRTWKREPVSLCPGLPVYDWGTAPEHYKTKSQLKELGLKPPKDPSSYIPYKRDFIALYDMTQATQRPKPTEKQLAALDKARQKQKELRICQVCGREYPNRKWLHGGICISCKVDIFIADDHQKATEWARNLLASPEAWLILDTETTSLRGEAIQIAVIDPSGQMIFDELIKPDGVIEPSAQAVHGISLEMLIDKPDFSDIHLRLSQLLTGKKTVAYNVEFDRAILDADCRRHGLPALDTSWECAMLWYAQWFGEWSDHFQDYRWQPLYGGDHTAAGDCRAVLSLIQEMAGDEH